MSAVTTSVTPEDGAAAAAAAEAKAAKVAAVRARKGEEWHVHMQVLYCSKGLRSCTDYEGVDYTKGENECGLNACSV